MLNSTLEIRTADGVMNCFLTQPESETVVPLVLLLMDAPGLREELFAMARQLGVQGYAVAVPNLYYRRTRQGVEGGDREAMYGHMLSLNAADVCVDLTALLDELAAMPRVGTDVFGCVGYCMSGPLAIAAAAHFGQPLAAAASIHGVRLCHQGLDSVHRLLNQVRGELYIGCAEADAWAPPRLISLLERHLNQANVRHQVEWYPDTRHGFVFPERAGIYQAAAAQRHWRRLQALFSRNLHNPEESA